MFLPEPRDLLPINCNGNSKHYLNFKNYFCLYMSTKAEPMQRSGVPGSDFRHQKYSLLNENFDIFHQLATKFLVYFIVKIVAADL